METEVKVALPDDVNRKRKGTEDPDKTILNECIPIENHILYILTVIVQRVKVPVAILTDLNLLPYKTAIIQWRKFDKDICTSYNWI